MARSPKGTSIGQASAATCRSAQVLLAALALGASACTVTLGTGAQQPQQPVYWVDGNGAPAQPQPVVAGSPQPVQVGAVAPPPAQGPVPQAPTPVYTPMNPPGIVTGPRHVGTPGISGRGGIIVLPRGSAFGGDGSTFAGTLYFVPVGAPKMPDFSTLPAQALTSTDHFNIPLTNAQGSLPPWPDRVEGFGLEYTGSFDAPMPGTYHFLVYSDDGAIVYVDGKMVTNNDGIHDPRGVDGTVSLAAGRHTIRLDYYLAYRWTVQLQLYVVRPDGNKELFGPQL